MMTLLAAAVTFVGLLCLLDLALTIGVIRRLREHSALLARRSSSPHGESVAAVGTRAADFGTLDPDGEPARRASFGGPPSLRVRPRSNPVHAESYRYPVRRGSLRCGQRTGAAG
jgi:hypothetical protein